jgi:RNA polymerase sigma-70 factor (ECF subfamily)
MTLLALAFSSLGGPAPEALVPATEGDVQAWIAAALRGDAAGARSLYAAYVGRVYRTVRPLCADDAEAEDVTQDAFARALEALDRYAPREGTPFLAWLSTIALNVARKSRRRRARTRPTEPLTLAALAEPGDGAPAHESLEPLEPLDRATLREALLRSLETLEPREREIISLRYGGELDAKEISALLGESHANVRKIEQRARQALRAEVERSLARRAAARRTPR